MADRFAFGRKECTWDNWDLYGAKAITTEVFNNAERIIEEYSVQDRKIEVNYFGSGKIELEWETVHGTLTVEVGPNEYLVYLADFNMVPLKELFSTTRQFT